LYYSAFNASSLSNFIINHRFCKVKVSGIDQTANIEHIHTAKPRHPDMPVSYPPAHISL
jgi:hypothetical protein